MSVFRILTTIPVFQMLTAVVGFLGMFNASFQPYQSLIGIEKIGLSPDQFAMILILSSAIGVGSSVGLGILSDQRPIRRKIALITIATALCGAILMLLMPSKLSFILANGILIPVATSLYSQAFAVIRLASEPYPQARQALPSSIRAGMSFAFLSVLLFWLIAFSLGVSVMATYATAALSCLAMLVVVYRFWPRAGEEPWEEKPSGLSFFSALAEMARPEIAQRMLCLGAIQAPLLLYVVLTGLVFEKSALRSTSDISLYIGMMAGCEVPIMLILPRYFRKLPRSLLMVLGSVCYSIHVCLMPVLVDTPWLWLLPLSGGLGGSIVLLIPLSYYQEIMQDRPGAASAMIAVQRLVADWLSAACFAVGLMLGGYSMAALLATILSLTAVGLLIWLDRYRPVKGGTRPQQA